MAKHVIAKMTVRISHPMLAFHNKIAGLNLSAGMDRGCEALAFYKCSYFLTSHTVRLDRILNRIPKKSHYIQLTACEDYKEFIQA